MKTIVTGMMLVSGLAYGGSDLVNPGMGTTLRDLAADRPDATESPVTVDKGRWQVEMSVVDYAKDFQFEAWTWAETNLKYGVTDSVDVQLVFSPFVEERAGGVRSEGASDLTVRVKWNLWGNDEGKSAFALFPYVKIPTDTDVSNGRWEGGLILPFAYQINEKLGFGTQAEFAYEWDGGEYDLEFLHTAVLGYSLTEKVGVYGEYLGVAGGHSYEAYASGGVAYAVTPLFQLDAGAIVGLNDAAEDLNVFTGFTVKF